MFDTIEKINTYLRITPPPQVLKAFSREGTPEDVLVLWNYIRSASDGKPVDSFLARECPQYNSLLQMFNAMCERYPQFIPMRDNMFGKEENYANISVIDKITFSFIGFIGTFHTHDDITESSELYGIILGEFNSLPDPIRRVAIAQAVKESCDFVGYGIVCRARKALLEALKAEPGTAETMSEPVKRASLLLVANLWVAKDHYDFCKQAFNK